MGPRGVAARQPVTAWGDVDGGLGQRGGWSQSGGACSGCVCPEQWRSQPLCMQGPGLVMLLW